MDADLFICLFVFRIFEHWILFKLHHSLFDIFFYPALDLFPLPASLPDKQAASSFYIPFSLLRSPNPTPAGRSGCFMCLCYLSLSLVFNLPPDC